MGVNPTVVEGGWESGAEEGGEVIHQSSCFVFKTKEMKAFSLHCLAGLFYVVF